VVPQNDEARVSFLTDVKNNYFTRSKAKGNCKFAGPMEPTFRLFNGRLTFTFHPEKQKRPVGTTFDVAVTIADGSHGPWNLQIKVKVGPPREKRENEKPEHDQKTGSGQSRPIIIEVKNGADALPIAVEKEPGKEGLQLAVNIESRLLTDAKDLRPAEDAGAVEFVFKYGLALIAMGLLDAAKKTPDWANNEVGCRDQIAKSASAIARVIVPLCLTLPQKLPKKFSKAA
jgi:hypothetical protein